jgi:hypothetical protein
MNKFQLVRQTHHPELSRKVNLKIQNQMTKIFTKVVSFLNPIPNLLAMMLLCQTLDRSSAENIRNWSRLIQKIYGWVP